jgi:hypothetical protein
MPNTEKVTTALIIEQWRGGKAGGAAVPLNLSELRKEAQQRLKKAIKRGG